MLDALLLKKKIPGPDPVDPNALFQLDMSPAAGSQVLKDLVSGVTFTRVGNPTIPDGFVDHPTYGHCYRFTGGTSFVGTGALSAFNFNTLGYYLIEFEMITDNTNFMCLFETGDYPPSSKIKAGSNCSFNQFSSTFFQYFQVTSSGSYQRNQLSAANPLTMNKYSIKRSASGTLMSDVTRGISTNFANFNTGGDSYFWIGAASDNGTPGYWFSGYLRSLKISKVTS
uniref:Uncharacterized protein n=1 Tax=Burkholderia phage vB_BgluM-SURPRISE13 TaxID=3159457 RepID=A0AAU7PFP9_9VIRU